MVRPPLTSPLVFTQHPPSLPPFPPTHRVNACRGSAEFVFVPRLCDSFVDSCSCTLSGFIFLSCLCCLDLFLFLPFFLEFFVFFFHDIFPFLFSFSRGWLLLLFSLLCLTFTYFRLSYVIVISKLNRENQCIVLRCLHVVAPLTLATNSPATQWPQHNEGRGAARVWLVVLSVSTQRKFRDSLGMWETDLAIYLFSPL